MGSIEAIGIDAITFSVPRSYLDLGDLAVARGVAADKYRLGLGVSQMAIAAADEDPVALAAGAGSRLLAASGRDPSEIGFCAVGTETAVDHSKPVSSYVHGLLGLPSRCRVFETKHACFGATAALLSATEWIASGAARGRAALIIASDIARYEIGSPGEPTQGAGAVAMLVSERPRLLELEVGRTGSFARDVHDFWRPLHRKDALVDGKFSVECYLDALGHAYRDWQEQAAGGEPLVRTCYHVPYGKMAHKAHRVRSSVDGLDEAAADRDFELTVAPSLRFASQVGNIYAGSLYLALASLLHAEAAALEGRRIGLFSDGSGCAAEFFAGRVAAGAAAMVARLDLGAPLAPGARARLTIPAYEALRRDDASADRRASEVSSERPFAFLGVDPAERRRYMSGILRDG